MWVYIQHNELLPQINGYCKRFVRGGIAVGMFVPIAPNTDNIAEASRAINRNELICWGNILLKFNYLIAPSIPFTFCTERNQAGLITASVGKMLKVRHRSYTTCWSSMENHLIPYILFLNGVLQWYFLPSNSANKVKL